MSESLSVSFSEYQVVAAVSNIREDEDCSSITHLLTHMFNQLQVLLLETPLL